jgi:hypothetical protein
VNTGLSKYGALRAELEQRDKRIAELDVLVSSLNARIDLENSCQEAAEIDRTNLVRELATVKVHVAALNEVLSSDLRTIASMAEQIKTMGEKL